MLSQYPSWRGRLPVKRSLTKAAASKCKVKNHTSDHRFRVQGLGLRAKARVFYTFLLGLLSRSSLLPDSFALNPFNPSPKPVSVAMGLEKSQVSWDSNTEPCLIWYLKFVICFSNMGVGISKN